jgi:hypothetical protein
MSFAGALSESHDHIALIIVVALPGPIAPWSKNIVLSRLKQGFDSLGSASKINYLRTIAG